MREVWADIAGSSGVYEVSTKGNVRSKTRYVFKSDIGRDILRKGKVLSLTKRRDGYLHVGLYFTKKQYMLKVHRLVAETFLDRIDGKPEVNHMNGNKSDNRVENLEWVSREENMSHSYEHLGRRSAWKNCPGALHPKSRPVIQYSLAGEAIRHWESMGLMEKATGFFYTNISACCRGKQKTAYGYRWKYQEQVDAVTGN